MSIILINIICVYPYIYCYCRFSTSVSPFRASSRDQLTGMASASHGNLFSPNYQDSFPDEVCVHRRILLLYKIHLLSS